MNLCSVIIPIFNTDYPPAHYTGNCIGSVKTYTKLPYEIIVIDNASTVELGGLKWPEVVDKYVKNETNVGVPKAWNQGVAESSGDYIAILNSDIQVFDYWLEDMVEALEHVQLVMARPMYDLPYGRAKEALERREQWANEEPDKYLIPDADFSCFALKRSTYDEVGPFDENYGLGYGEDVDYRYRMEQKGMVAKATKKVNIHHVGMATGHTLGLQGLNLGEIMNKNKEYTQKKHDLDEFGIPGWRRNAQV